TLAPLLACAGRPYGVRTRVQAGTPDKGRSPRGRTCRPLTRAPAPLLGCGPPPAGRPAPAPAPTRRLAARRRSPARRHFRAARELAEAARKPGRRATGPERPRTVLPQRNLASFAVDRPRSSPLRPFSV